MPEIHIDPDFVDGAHVAKDQLLIRIDHADAQSALELARTGLICLRDELADSLPEDARPLGGEAVPRGDDVLHLEAHVMDAARGVAFEKPGDGRV